MGPIPSDTREIASFSILFDDTTVSYHRTYYNILFVLANIGGLANLLFLLGNFFIKPISKLALDIFLVNQFYLLEKSEENTESMANLSPDSIKVQKQRR